ELVGAAITPGRDLRLLRGPHVLNVLAGLAGGGGHGGGQPVGVELARQQVVDGHATGGDLAARNTRDEAGQPAARAVGQAQDVNGRLHGAGGDVDDAAKAACGHAVHRGLDELDGGQHVGIHRLDPCVTVPVAEVTGGWAA